ncbi:RICIN domain-containing protein [Sedimentisphaera salicampi]|uniref:Ricin-type beta-trefoil lectin domain protein n=1 Tax=Sedimentisphaera salicampi TaxID=1941349 RepID=A0A1W6LJ81_9BACT|nr:RICIN domain-containing protein [Sedimentisphaera salicampi]ARN55837.1 Ricin-type beta-trefoil lectin domain protein [Sedimentisphaera salicampi]
MKKNIRLETLAVLITSLFCSGSLHLEADLNTDNFVDISDFGILSSDYSGIEDFYLIEELNSEWLLASSGNYEQDLYLPLGNAMVPGSSYPRVIELSNGNLVATFSRFPEDYSKVPYFPVYKSCDGGRSWNKISEIHDTHNGSSSIRWGMRWQPVLFEMPRDVVGCPEGAILCAGITVSPDWQHIKIDVYRSLDEGLSWSYLSTVAEGNWGSQPIWEPFFTLGDDDKLYCFFSDERDPEHEQKISHKSSSTGGYFWGDLTEDVALGTNLRPGMPIVERMPNGEYIMVYEIVKLQGNPIYYKISSSLSNWPDSSQRGTKITSECGYTPGSSPFVTSGTYNQNGSAVIVSGMFQSPGTARGSDNFINFNNARGSWYRMQNPLEYQIYNKEGYSRSIEISSDNTTLYSMAPVNHQGEKAKISFNMLPIKIMNGFNYRLTPASHLNLNADVESASNENGAAVILWDILDNPNQSWKFEIAEKTEQATYYKLKNINSSQYLAVGGGSMYDGATLCQWPETGNHSQHWSLEYTGGGFYYLQARHSGKVLQVNPNGIHKRLVQYTKNGSDEQRWLILPVE